jgi:hypothetical protein
MVLSQRDLRNPHYPEAMQIQLRDEVLALWTTRSMNLPKKRMMMMTRMPRKTD